MLTPKRKPSHIAASHVFPIIGIVQIFHILEQLHATQYPPVFLLPRRSMSYRKNILISSSFEAKPFSLK